MKKINMGLITIFILSIVLCTLYVSQANTLSDQSNIFIDKNEKQEIEYSTKNNEKIKLKYKQTQLDKDYDLKFLTYEDTDNNQYIFDGKSNKLKSVVFPGKVKEKIKDENKIFDKNLIKSNAVKESEKYVDISKYTLEGIEFKEDTKVYELQWVKYIGGIKTCDLIKITMQEDGAVLIITMPNVGELDNRESAMEEISKDIYISKKEALNIIDKEISKVHPTYEHLTYKDYIVSEEELYFNEDGKLVWSFLLGLKYLDARGNEVYEGTSIVIDAVNGEIVNSNK